MRWFTLVILMVGSLLLSPRLATEAAAIPANGIKGTAEGVIRESGYRSDGHQHVDTPATISRLQALHANTYEFLVRDVTDWPDLATEFMPAAQAAGIRIFVYLLPPTECPTDGTDPSPYTTDSQCNLYLPDHRDYVAWGRDIARLSNQFPMLTAWTIDDMDSGQNLTRLFTDTYVRQMNVAASAIQPHLDFYMQLYQPTVTQALVDRYAYAIDGMIMPYRDGAYRNTAWTGTEQAAIDSISGMLARQGKRLILMVYGNELSATVVRPDATYVAQVVTMALANTASGKIAGVIVWNMVLDPSGSPAGGSFNMALTGSGALSLSVNPSTSTAAGQYAQASTTITLNPGSSSCTLVLRHTDDRAATSELGYHDKQVWVGNTLVWRRDVASEGTAWEWSSPLNLMPYLSNGSATFTLRLAELKQIWNYEVNAVFDDVGLTGCSVPNPSFETDDGWSLSRSGGPVLAKIYHFSPTFTTDAFAAVAARF